METCCTIILNELDELDDEPKRSFWAVANGRMFSGVVLFEPGEGLGDGLAVCIGSAEDGEYAVEPGHLGDLDDDAILTEKISSSLLRISL